MTSRVWKRKQPAVVPLFLELVSGNRSLRRDVAEGDTVTTSVTDQWGPYHRHSSFPSLME